MPTPHDSRTVRRTKKPTRSTVRIASDSLNRTYNSIPAAWRAQAENTPSPKVPTGTALELSERLERLDGLPPVYSLLQSSINTSENSRSRISIKTPTKPASRIVLRTPKVAPNGTSRVGPTSKTTVRSAPKSEVGVNVRSTPTKTTPKPKLTVDTKVGHGSLMTSKLRNHVPTATKATMRRMIPTLDEDPLYYFPHLKISPRSQQIRKDEFGGRDLETRIRFQLQHSQSDMDAFNFVKMDPAIISCGPVVSDKTGQWLPLEVPSSVLTRTRRDYRGSSSSEGVPGLAKSDSTISPLDPPTPDSSVHDISPRNLTTVIVPTVSSIFDGPSSISSTKEKAKFGGTQKLNPCAKEFTTLRAQIPVKRIDLLQMVSGVGKDLYIPKKRRSQALSAPEPIYMKTVDIPITGYASDPSLPQHPPPSRTAFDDQVETGRVAYAMDPELAASILQTFTQVFPMTGNRRYVPSPPPATVKGRHAATMQQRIEFLIMQQKEKKAFESLQTQIEAISKAINGCA